MLAQAKSHFLSLIIPSYRQEKTIIKDLRKIKRTLDNTRYEYEIIVIIDGKVDKTYEKIKKAKLNKVHCFTYFKNQGKAYAIRHGFYKAHGDYIMFLDAGREIDPNGISMLLEHMEWYNADIIVGSKRHPASFVNYPLDRKILSYGYFYLVKILFGIKVSDTQAGIKVFKSKVLKKILPRLVEKRFAGDIEMLIVASELGFNRIYEAPIKLDYSFSPLTSAALWFEVIRIFIDTVRLYFRKLLFFYHKNK